MRLKVVDAEKCVGCQCCMFACTRRFGKSGTSKSSIHIKSNGENGKGFIVIVCRACKSPPCAEVCPNNALKLRNGGGVVLDSAKCIGCGMCKNACILKAVFTDNKNKPMICIHCGTCAKYCPYGVLALRKEENEDVKE